MAMYQRINYLLFALCGLVAFSSCKSESPQERASVSEEASSEQQTPFRQFRALYHSGRDQVLTRFLGKGFDALHHQSDDSEGMSDLTILDLRRLEQDSPWNAWSSHPVPGSVYAPEAVIQPKLEDPTFTRVEDVTKSYNEKTITASLGLNIKPVKLDFNMNRVEKVDEKVHTYRQVASRPFFLVNYDGEDSAYAYFLHRRFVADVKNLSAQALVRKYGTHLVTGYQLGAMASLTVSARQRYYSKDETFKLTASAMSNSLSYEQKRKATQNEDALRVIYRQGGSDYTPAFKEQVVDLFSPSKQVSGFDYEAWKRQIRPNDKSFMSLSARQQIAIPDLIQDPMLKWKYLCGIVHEANPGKRITYVLATPGSFASVLKDGQRIYAFLSGYESQVVSISYGNRLGESLSEKALRGQGRGTYGYYAQYDNATGNWTFRYMDDNALGSPAMYLCRDLSLRTVAEDVQGLRYWVINPVVPNGSWMYQKLWDNLLIPDSTN